MGVSRRTISLLGFTLSGLLGGGQSGASRAGQLVHVASPP